jgi:hypothetical protein
MNKKATIIAIVLLLLLPVLASLFISRGSTNDEAVVENTVTNFGTRLKNVSLLAPSAELAQELQENYAPYVTPELITSWEASPMQAPGRLTSSPWPDSITIGSVEKQSDGSYGVTGSVIEITSTGPAGSYPVALRLEKINGTWLITDFSGYPPQQAQQQTP